MRLGGEKEGKRSDIIKQLFLDLSDDHKKKGI
jgi:hypothetical protein